MRPDVAVAQYLCDLVDTAMLTEVEHANLYRKALAAVKPSEKANFYVCPVCGYTVDEMHFDACPICKVPKEKFEVIS